MEKKADSPPATPEAEKAAEEKQEVVLKKGPWTTGEDTLLVEYVRRHGEGNWNAVRRSTGLARCGKSCRLRWTNHLRPNLKKGSFSPEEELLISRLHSQLGNKWARMASQLPGRTDNEIKNYWNTRLKRRQRAGLPIYPPEVQLQLALPKRSRYEFSLSPPLEGNVQPVDAANASSAGYTSVRPPPLDLAGQFAMPNRPVEQLIAPLPFSAPSSPWENPLGPSGPLWLQLPRSSPVSPATPNAPVLPVTPDLSLGYGIRSGLTPLSPSPGVKMELPSSQLGLALPLASAISGAGMVGGLQAPQNSTSLEAMMQELHDAMEDKVMVAEGDREGHGGGGDGGFVIEPDSGNGECFS